MGGLLDLPASRDFPKGLQQVIPAEDKDFHRPLPNYQSNDINLADSDSFILQVQQFLKSSPLGVSYSETPDGILSSTLLDSLRNFQEKLNQKTGKNFNLISGNSIKHSGFLEALRAYRDVRHLKEEKPKEDNKKQLKSEEKPEEKGLIEKEIEEIDSKSSEEIKHFQQFFSTSQPLIGVVYRGPVDGEANSELIQATKSVENTISKAINKPVSGMLWSDNKKSFLTSPQDLEQALKLIVKNRS